jgi:hypothetical protein
MAGIVGTITNLSDFLSKTQVCLSVKPNDPQQQIICLEADRKYSIPAFQREVRWDDNNLKMLLYDLSRSSKFLGNIILTIKSDHTCEIIDGQQRTTVLMEKNCPPFWRPSRSRVFIPPMSCGNFSKIVLVCSASVILTSQAI